MFHLIIFTLLISQISPIEILSPKPINENINRFIRWFLQNASCITVISTNATTTDIILKGNFHVLHHTFKIYSQDSVILPRYEVSEGYVIISENINVIIKALLKFTNFQQKIATNFLVILHGEDDYHGKIFAESLAIKLKNLLVLKKIFTQYKVFHYNFFKNETNVFEVDDVDGILKAFYNMDYNGHEIKGTLFNNPPTCVKLSTGRIVGPDYNIFKTISKKLNFSLLLHEPYDGNQHGSRGINSAATGAISELYTGAADVTCNQMFLKNYNAPELLFTSPAFSDLLCVVVSKAQRKPGWSAFLSTYSWGTWILMTFTLMVAFLCLYCTRKVKRLMTNDVATLKRHSYSRSGFGLWCDLVQIVCSTIPQKNFINYHYERIFLGSLLIYALIVSTSFQGSLVNLIRNARYYKDINTLEDLDATGYIITTTSKSLEDTFSQSKTSYIQSLDKKLKIIKKTDKNGEAYLTTASRFRFNKIFQSISNQESKLHMINECPQSYLMSYLMHRDSMFYNDIKKVLDILLEAGLPEKWLDDVIVYISLKYKHPSSNANWNRDHNQELVVFTLNDMQLSFYVLIVGLFGSTLVFGLEYLKYIGVEEQ